MDKSQYHKSDKAIQHEEAISEGKRMAQEVTKKLKLDFSEVNSPAPPDLTAFITQVLKMVRIEPVIVQGKTRVKPTQANIPWAISGESIKLIAPELAKQIRQAGYEKVLPTGGK
jgi:hypothetical protein